MITRFLHTTCYTLPRRHRIYSIVLRHTQTLPQSPCPPRSCATTDTLWRCPPPGECERKSAAVIGNARSWTSASTDSLHLPIRSECLQNNATISSYRTHHTDLNHPRSMTSAPCPPTAIYPRSSVFLDLLPSVQHARSLYRGHQTAPYRIQGVCSTSSQRGVPAAADPKIVWPPCHSPQALRSSPQMIVRPPGVRELMRTNHIYTHGLHSFADQEHMRERPAPMHSSGPAPGAKFPSRSRSVVSIANLSVQACPITTFPSTHSTISFYAFNLASRYLRDESRRQLEYAPSLFQERPAYVTSSRRFKSTSQFGTGASPQSAILPRQHIRRQTGVSPLGAHLLRWTT